MKKNISKIAALFAIFASVSLVSCDKDEASPATSNGSLEIDFDARIDGVKLDTSSVYTNINGETLKISTFNYFVSNIKLKKSDGTIYTHPQDSSYFLIKSPSNQTIKLKNVPAGDYNELTFTIGVDSARSVSDISKRGGVLDPAVGAKGMYWSWNSGYIFAKLEGYSPSVAKSYKRHIGLYGGVAVAGQPKTLNNLQTKTLSFGTAKAMVRTDITPEIHLLVNPLKMFGADSISITKNPVIMGSLTSKGVAQAYPAMFEFGHVHND